MRNTSKRGGVMAAAIVFIAIAVLAAAGAAFFMVDGMRVNGALAKVDAIGREETTAKKGARAEAGGVALTAEAPTESLDAGVYHSPLGVSIVSHSDQWQGQKLVDIYEELLKNGHGDEIYYLSEVVLEDGGADYSADAVADTRDASLDGAVFVDIPALIPPHLSYDTGVTCSVITLYNMDYYDDAIQLAKALAHEYGHHYTMHYFMQDDEAVRNSEYYTLRDFKGYNHQVFYNLSSPSYNHTWDIYEIAAEDYVQLMGSPDTRLTAEYMDPRDLLEGRVQTYDPELHIRDINVFPQENIYIPLADQNPGLRDYFYSWIDKENEYDTPIESADLSLHIEAQSSYGHNYYMITWNTVNTDPDALYTLVCYTEEGDLYWPVRTVHGDEEPNAVVGEYAMQMDGYVNWCSNHVTEEDRIFKLYLMLPDGRMQASEPFYVDF